VNYRNLILSLVIVVCFFAGFAAAEPYSDYQFPQSFVPSHNPAPSTMIGDGYMLSYRGVQPVSCEGYGVMFAEADEFVDPPIDPAEFVWIWQ